MNSAALRVSTATILTEYLDELLASDADSDPMTRTASLAVDLVTVGRMQVALPRGYVVRVDPHDLDAKLANEPLHLIDGLSLIPARYRAVCEARRRETLDQPLRVAGTSLVLVGCELTEMGDLQTRVVRWREPSQDEPWFVGAAKNPACLVLDGKALTTYLHTLI